MQLLELLEVIGEESVVVAQGNELRLAVYLNGFVLERFQS